MRGLNLQVSSFLGGLISLLFGIPLSIYLAFSLNYGILGINFATYLSQTIILLYYISVIAKSPSEPLENKDRQYDSTCDSKNSADLEKEPLLNKAKSQQAPISYDCSSREQ